ncbi:SRPBCC family protein [Amycolatopsis sp. A133]|uniref:SRPBCC family protein n=1 Tax=Amycolatopsis sp. A133 TaxID=3064472 RepID=UPI0027F342BA|nr:SRPBCC family protein [Amycolatopsis sp. A133]MDQ7809320.1 SRPBCC family protein [Amycolatopsis sp. A133]
MDKATHHLEVRAPAQACYDWWRPLTRLPEIFSDVESVEAITGDEARTRWKVAGPVGATVEWEARITEDSPPHRLAWATVAESDPDVTNSGVVLFEDKGDGVTELTVSLDYSLPGGKLGEAVASLLADPQRKVERACAEFKRIIETR